MLRNQKYIDISPFFQSMLQCPSDDLRLMQLSASYLYDAEDDANFGFPPLFQSMVLTHWGLCSLEDDVFLHIPKKLGLLTILVSFLLQTLRLWSFHFLFLTSFAHLSCCRDVSCVDNDVPTHLCDLEIEIGARTLQTTHWWLKSFWQSLPNTLDGSSRTILRRSSMNQGWRTLFPESVREGNSYFYDYVEKKVIELNKKV